ncbi:hypothetical protein E5C31_11975 [Providencia rettgeri]|uniref:Uncharacterized protein n=2 Tax=Alcaligenes TaxID=507 RepID=A0ABY7NBD9_ALCFA|nr:MULTISPECIES: hypothetical protein [Alcaligenes]MBY6346681.1 hypothetical protein [Providencia rettgeri]ALO39695.1 hypothetical protein UZ73_16320 [Alcaligenes faecalis]MCX5567188.1 hypothetical protein [Alcaligenes phenolicus]QTC00235.1 hypothetical protein JYG33_01815 [Alcaligenes sp. SORT26]WBM39722.1 hypothetical protein M2J83_07895 [Alcaligenes faecalis]
MALKINRLESVLSQERWEDYTDDVSFKLTRLDTEAYQIALERVRRLIAREDAGQSLSSILVSDSDVREHDIQCQLLGRYIIRDWKGQIQDETGRQVPYSPENAAALLSGDSDLFTWVLLHAAQLAKEAQEEAKETVEKSSPGSSGKKSGPGQAKSAS